MWQIRQENQFLYMLCVNTLRMAHFFNLKMENKMAKNISKYYRKVSPSGPRRKKREGAKKFPPLTVSNTFPFSTTLIQSTCLYKPQTHISNHSLRSDNHISKLDNIFKNKHEKATTTKCTLTKQLTRLRKIIKDNHLSLFFCCPPGSSFLPHPPPLLFSLNRKKVWCCSSTVRETNSN